MKGVPSERVSDIGRAAETLGSDSSQVRGGQQIKPTRLVAAFLDAVTEWARSQTDVVGVALVGSQARGVARDDADIDLVVLMDRPQVYLRNNTWTSKFGEVVLVHREDWGRIQSLRVWYADGREVEYGLTTPEWASVPLDRGTLRVASEGLRVLFDRVGLLAAMLREADSGGCVQS